MEDKIEDKIEDQMSQKEPTLRQSNHPTIYNKIAVPRER